MANKRTLKKNINVICSELFAECVAASLYGNLKNKDNAESLLHSIVKIESEYTSRISHPEPGMPAHVYFKDLIEKFNIAASEIADHISYFH